MKKLRWQILVVLLTLIIVGVLLLSQKPTQISKAPEPVAGGIYTEALVGSFGRLNPLLDINNPADRDIDRLLFSSLIRFDPNGVQQPDLAESWGVSEDGKDYNFTLRDNAYWHDGTPVTSDDVLFTINLLRSQYSAYPADVHTLWDNVDITRVNEKNFRLSLTEPFVPFLDYLTFGVLPEHLLRNVAADQLASNNFNLAPVGTGPFKFDHLMTEQGKITGVVLAANDKYYGQAPFLEQMVFRYYPDEQSAWEAYKVGEVLGISQVPAAAIPTACADPNISCYSSRLPRLSLVLFNLGDSNLPYFQDKKIRTALMEGLNRDWMIAQILKGQAILADGPILPDTWAYYNGLKRVDYDPDAARALLKDPAILILDDPLSAVDAGTEEEILASLAGFYGQRTVIIVSHRLSALHDCDTIIYLDNGRIIEQGSHQQLLALDGRYAALHREQQLRQEIERI